MSRQHIRLCRENDPLFIVSQIVAQVTTAAIGLRTTSVITKEPSTFSSDDFP
jgi:hypothetical protein